jgi:hypothetical protein
MLLSSFYVDKNTYYCRQINDKNLELINIQTHYEEYKNKAAYFFDIKYYVCADCIPMNDLFKINKITNNIYKINKNMFPSGFFCIICHLKASWHCLRHLLFGKFAHKQYCADCLYTKWNTRTCENCGYENVHDLFKTICDSCISMKTNELHLCTYYLDYNADITHMIIKQLEEIKNYAIIKN